MLEVFIWMKRSLFAFGEEFVVALVFALVPSQILIMVSGLLCSNNITYRFGKGMMPEAWLNVSSCDSG